MRAWTMLAILLTGATPDKSAAGWAGEWRLDRTASQFRGDVTRIVRVPRGYRFDLGAVRFVLPADGAFHPTIPGRETSLQPIGARSWRRQHLIAGRIVDTSSLTVAADDRTLTITGEHPGAPPETLRREGGGSGLAGTWRSTRPGINAAPLLSLAALGLSRLRWGSPADGNWYEVTIDGPPAVDTGPTATPIAAFQVMAARDGLHWIERLYGRPSRLGIERRSADGRTLTETSWPAAAPQERQMLVYRRVDGGGSENQPPR